MALNSRLESLDNIIKTKSFLGREFLTWLWFASETEGQIFNFTTIDGMRLEAKPWVDDRIVLHAHNAGTYALKGGRPSESPEATIALKCGKTVSDMKLGLHIDGIGDFTATIDGKDLNPRSLCLPIDNPEHENIRLDLEAPIEQRLYLTDLFLAAFEAIFQKFLDQRTSSDWVSGEESMRRWTSQKTINSELYH